VDIRLEGCWPAANALICSNLLGDHAPGAVAHAVGQTADTANWACSVDPADAAVVASGLIGSCRRTEVVVS
jgi:hypothetical protein